MSRLSQPTRGFAINLQDAEGILVWEAMRAFAATSAPVEADLLCAYQPVQEPELVA